MTDIATRVVGWACGADTGMSSHAMAAHLVGVKSSGRCPGDGGDLGRCIRLLDTIPELRERLPLMADLSPSWAALIKHWPELEAQYRSGHRMLYERMRQILDPVEREQRSARKFGGGA